jgi:hypothetical protein
MAKKLKSRFETRLQLFFYEGGAIFHRKNKIIS